MWIWNLYPIKKYICAIETDIQAEINRNGRNVTDLLKQFSWGFQAISNKNDKNRGGVH